MLTRVADALYWLGRYVERAENIARLVDVSLLVSLDAPRPSDLAHWLPVVETTGDTECFQRQYPRPDRAAVLRFLAFDEDNPNSIFSCLRAARENARAIREIISSEMWEQLNTFYLLVREAALQAAAGAPVADSFFPAVKQQRHLFSGISANTMSHNEAWHFTRLGIMMERADKTSRLLDVKYFLLLPSVNDVGGILDEGQWVAVLRSASAFEMYRKKHGRISPEAVVEFLVLDAEFPRAIRRCVSEADRCLRVITGSPAGVASTRAERLFGRLRAEFDYTSPRDILAGGLHEFLDTFQTRLNEAGQALQETYFSTGAGDP
jgi:uncharacterized alpha-E superfamily protein